MSLELNALFRKYAGTLADLDSQEFRANQAATANQKKIDETLVKTEKNRSDVNATKGMTHSGVNLEQSVNNKSAAGADRAINDQNTTNALAEIARKRLTAESDYETAKAYDPIKMLQTALTQQ